MEDDFEKGKMGLGQRKKNKRKNTKHTALNN